MRIEVAELWRRQPLSTLSSSISADYGRSSWEAALYLPIPQGAELAALDSLVQRVSPAVRRSIDAVVLRAHQDDLLRLRAEPAITRSLIQRVEGRPCYTAEIVGTAHGLIPLANAAQVAKADETIILKAVRHAELENLTYRPSVILPKTGTFHYEGPNGSHYDSFLRPGMALQSPDAVDGVVFWLLPRVQPGTVVLLDTWSMMSLGYALRIAAGPNITRVTSIERYDEPVSDVLRRMSGANGQLPTRVLVIVSISSTGTLIKRLMQACQSGAQTVVDAVSLFSSAQLSCGDVGEVFCQVGQEFRRSSIADCEACKHRRQLVKIDSSTYLLAISAAVEPTAINTTVSLPATEFFRRYRGTECISVHRTDPLTKRHHMLYVDVGVLLSDQTFLQRLNERVQHLRGRIKAIICPNHPSAIGLATAAQGSLGLDRNALIVTDENEIARLPAADRDLLTPSSDVLVVDDVTITGHRLRGFRHALIKAGLGAATYHFLVGVERSPGARTLRGIKDIAHLPGALLAVETLILPNWSEDECPWCWELDQLKTAAAELGDLGDAMRARYAALRDAEAGLTRDLFLHVESPDHRPKQLGPQSIFGELKSDVEVFATVASAVQRLRSDGKLSERFETPIAKVLEPELSVQGRWYVTVVTASILRAVRAHDLRTPSTEIQLFKEFEARLVAGNEESDLRAEILLAVARDIIPRINPWKMNAPYLATLESGVSTFLRAIVRA